MLMSGEYELRFVDKDFNENTGEHANVIFDHDKIPYQAFGNFDKTGTSRGSYLKRISTSTRLSGMPVAKGICTKLIIIPSRFNHTVIFTAHPMSSTQ